jgi:hypothetical protein
VNDELTPIERVRARHSPNRHGGAPWPCPTFLDTETPDERAEREAAMAEKARQARIDSHRREYVKRGRERVTAERRIREIDDDRDRIAAALVEELGGDQVAAAELLGVTVTRVYNHVAAANGVRSGMAHVPLETAQ